MCRVVAIFILIANLTKVTLAIGQDLEVPTPEAVIRNEQVQQKFFDALAQKAIGNYDRAALLLLEANQIQEKQPALQHELAKVYLSVGEVELARSFAFQAVQNDPTQYWYLDTYMRTIPNGDYPETLFGNSAQTNAPEISLNLARWYLNEQLPNQTLKVLDTQEGDSRYRILRIKARALKYSEDQRQESVPVRVTLEDEWSLIMQELEELLTQEAWDMAHSRAMEYLESYPLQPFLYYVAGKVLWTQAKLPEALEMLEMGEGLLVQEDWVSRGIYEMLMNIHQELGNNSLSLAYKNKLN
ncbi:MAG: hypothetical protein RLZZ241_1696 [Bacteroidota bacterium]|jgi:tetratricopeptide (TPR) repeat protein